MSLYLFLRFKIKLLQKSTLWLIFCENSFFSPLFHFTVMHCNLKLNYALITRNSIKILIWNEEYNTIFIWALFISSLIHSLSWFLFFATSEFSEIQCSPSWVGTLPVKSCVFFNFFFFLSLFCLSPFVCVGSLCFLSRI